MKPLLLSSYATLLLSSLVQALPATNYSAATPDIQAPTTLDLLKRTNHCGPSTFINQGSEASPLVSDCEVLVGNIHGDGAWTLRSGTHRTFATFGTCAFGATLHDNWLGSIGNEDVIDLITDSIRMFRRHDNKVGSKGTMVCNDSTGIMDWGLYHT